MFFKIKSLFCRRANMFSMDTKMNDLGTYPLDKLCHYKQGYQPCQIPSKDVIIELNPR